MIWQPIETAPQDCDTYILVFTGYGCDVVSCHWHDDNGQPVWFNGDVTVGATHWMPLPEPPHDP